MSARRLTLLAIALLLLAYNLWRYNHRRTAAEAGQPQPHFVDPSTTAAAMWNAYDRAATLADAPDAQFAPALANLRSASSTVDTPNLKPNADTLADIHGCTTWLLFYRENVNKPHPDQAWKDRAAAHLQSCAKNHADITR